jgi:chemotaxis protein MotB
MSKEEQPPIIIKKIIKKAGHGGHHGGAWKVAYADFVTAMMCLFLLLWLVNVDPSSKSVIADFFRQPTQTGPMDGNVFIFGGAKKPADPGKFDGGASFLEFQKLVLTGDNKEEVRKLILKDFKEEVEMEADKELFDRVKLSLVKEGILIEIKEEDKNPLFNSGSTVLTAAAMTIIDKLTYAIKDKVAPMVIAGHTDGTKYKFGRYDNWNLSTDRAHAIRQRMIFAGLDKKLIAKVEGYADTQLKLPEVPLASINRRITLLLLQQDEKDSLKPKYLNPLDEHEEYTKEDLYQESELKQTPYSSRAPEDVEDRETAKANDEGSKHEQSAKHDQAVYVSPTAGKINKPPTLEELRRKKERAVMRKTNPPSASGVDLNSAGAHGGGGEAPKKEEASSGHGGGHGGGH